MTARFRVVKTLIFYKEGKSQVVIKDSMKGNGNNVRNWEYKFF